MKKELIRIGVLGASEIAFRRFLPAIAKSDEFEYVGVASRDKQKTYSFIEKYGGKGFSNYTDLIEDKNIDAIYIPLPPALHFEWAKKALSANKHVLVEKPFTTKIKDTFELIELAKSRNLALHENYAFIYHRQLSMIKRVIDEGRLGSLRLIKASFGFPMRVGDAFRYNRELGGGALLDCGVYPIKVASLFLGDSLKYEVSKLNYLDNYDVDIYGSATFENNSGLVAQISFGMDNAYKCELEIWGSKGYLSAPRIFTAPPDFNVKLLVNINNQDEILDIGPDDQFLNSIEHFKSTIRNFEERSRNYLTILHQSELIEGFLATIVS